MRAFHRQGDLTLQEIDKLDSLSLECFRKERSPGQTRQGVGFEIDRSRLRNNEVRTRIATARHRLVRLDRLIHELCVDFRCKTAGTNFLSRLGQILRSE